MRKAKLFWELLLLLTSVCASLRGIQRKSVTCRVMYIEVYMAKGGENRLECEIVSGGSVGHSFPVHLPSKLVEKNNALMMKGRWFIRIPGAQVEKTHIRGYGMIASALNIPNQTNITTLPGSYARRRRHLATTGQRSLMVARVSVSDSAPTYSASQLQQWYFDPNSFSLARQYARCSSVQQIFSPWSTPVLEVALFGNIASFTQTTLVNAAVTAVQNALGGSSIPVQHIAFVLPPNLSTSFVAVGQVGGWRTTFYDTFGGIPDIIMHELGHNLGLGHSGVPGDAYGDFTSVMGYGELSQFTPSKCFNGCDHFNLGWFTDRTLVVDPSQGQQNVNLATFVDYNFTTAGQPVVLKIGEYSLSYNKAKGVNFQTEAAPNQVTVTLCGVGNKSTRLGILDETTPPYIQPNYNGGSQQLVIQVCNRALANSVDYAIVAVGMGSVSCGAPTRSVPPPTPLPVSSPTLAPLFTASPSASTRFPTSVPLATASPSASTLFPTSVPLATASPSTSTLLPTSVPLATATPSASTLLPTSALQTTAPTKSTAGPSFSPTPSPSTTPSTPPPTPLPTPMPSRQPTRKPSSKPTAGPSLKATIKPTLLPTKKPSSAPIKKPSVAAAPVPIAPFSLFINCGGKTFVTDSNGVTWSPDSYVSGSSTVLTTGSAIANTVDDFLYQTQRMGSIIQYNIPAPKVSNYEITMMFAEIDPKVQAVGARTFDILFEGMVAYQRFDIFSAAGGGFKAVSLIPVVVVTDGHLNITLVGQMNVPLLAALKVVAV